MCWSHSNDGTGTVSAALREHGIQKVTTNDLAVARSADMHADALQPEFYQKCEETHGVVDAVSGLQSLV
jgi:hypothetical protein